MRIPKPKHPILVVDDDQGMLHTYKDILTSLGLEFEMFSNGKLALTAAKEKEYSIYISDLDMPVMNGSTFIANLKSIKEDPIVLVATGVGDPEIVIEVMKLGVFDYILKPFNFDQVINVLRKALDFKNAKDNEKLQSKYASEKLRSQIEWLNYKENIRMKDKKESGLRNLEDMKNSFLEGASIGSIMTMIFMLKDLMQEREDGYLVDKEIMDTIIECNEVCRHQFEGIYSITNILESDLELTEMAASEFLMNIPGALQDIIPHFAPKNVKVTYPSLLSKARINVHQERLLDIIVELVINAYKFTVQGSTINILSFISEGYLIITVKNDVQQDPYSGIPKDYEKIILEPFIRLHSNDEQMIKIEKFGLGLGLTVVDNVVKKHNGMFFIHDVLDYTENKPKTCVVAEIFLPVLL